MADRPGLAGLTDDHLRRLEARQVTQSELARELGVKKQAVSKALQRRRAKAAGVVAPEPARTTPAPADRPPAAQPQQVATASPAERSDRVNETQAQTFDEAERWAEIGGQSWRGLAHAYAAVVVEARDQVVAGRGKIGPVAMNGLVRSLRESEEGLRRLGLLPAIAGGEKTNDQPANLVIRVLSPTEEAEIRAEIAERAGESLDNTAADSPIEPAPPVVAPSAMIPGTLPTPENFQAWLGTETHFRGTKWLKQVVGALGGKITHARETLIAEVLSACGGDPQKLQPLQVPA